MRNFSSIETVTWIDGPAAVDLKTGVLYINPVHFDKLSNVAKRFVIFHELGHLNASTDSEEAADEWAFEHMIDLGNSNVELLKAFYKSLPFSNKAQINRAEQMLI
ncbi:MAG: hypothetical protein LBM68_07000, partial [Bacteroidales bacterium]|nr:hypothetical protein [Bacteroidales bacterium]